MLINPLCLHGRTIHSKRERVNNAAQSPLYVLETSGIGPGYCAAGISGAGRLRRRGTGYIHPRSRDHSDRASCAHRNAAPYRRPATHSRADGYGRTGADGHARTNGHVGAAGHRGPRGNRRAGADGHTGTDSYTRANGRP